MHFSKSASMCHFVERRILGPMMIIIMIFFYFKLREKSEEILARPPSPKSAITVLSVMSKVMNN
jgi:hypothetical protein